MAAEITDAFTYSNGRLETVSSAVWDDTSASMAIASNRIAVSAANVSLYAIHATTLSNVDHYAQIAATPGNVEYTGCGVIVRGSSNPASLDGYRCELAFYSLAHHVEVSRIDAGSSTTVANASLGASDDNPHTLRVEVVGNTIEMYVDSVLELTYTGATSHTTNTRTGIYTGHFGGDTAFIDDFEAGTFAPPAVTGTAAVTLAPFVPAATGTYTPPAFTGTTAVTLAVFPPSASGTSVGSPSFTPAVLDGVSLRAWYDTSDAGTITGSPASALADKSSANLDLAQATAGRRPGTGAVTLNGLNVLTFDGGDELVAAAAADWKFLHDGTTYVTCAVVKFGTGSNPNTQYGLWGTNAGSSSTIGAAVFFDDAGARNNAIAHMVTRGVSTQGSVDCFVSDRCTPNVWNLVTVFGDPTATSAERSIMVVNGGLPARTNTKTFGVSASNPSHPFALGSFGNFVLPMVGQFAELVITDRHADIDLIHTYLSEKWGLGIPHHLDISGPVVVTL